MTYVRDPEFDEEPELEPGTCAVGRCDGSGWINVSEAYVDKRAPWPSMALPDDPTPEEQATFDAIFARVKLVRAGFRKTIYPCPSCLPEVFARWEGGHWDQNHNRYRCAECRVADGRRGRPRPQPKEQTDGQDPAAAPARDEPVGPPPRLDLD